MTHKKRVTAAVHRRYEDAIAFAERLVGHAMAVLDTAQPVAALLHGSLTMGDFVPGRSDVDLLLVVDHELTDAQVVALLDAARHAIATSDHYLDLRVVTRAAAASPTASPPMELHFGHHPGGPEEVETRVKAEPDLVVEFCVARAHGRSLAGRYPRDVIGPFPDDWVTRYGHQILERWEGLADDDPNAELMVLTACRIWRFAVTGAIVSKSSAARWALERDPSLSAIPAALRRRAGKTGVSIEGQDVADVLAAAKRASAAVLAAAHSPGG